MPEVSLSDELIILDSSSRQARRLVSMLRHRFPTLKMTIVEPHRAKIHRQGYKLILVFQGLWQTSGTDYIKTALKISPDLRFILLVPPDELDSVKTKFPHGENRPVCIVEPFGNIKKLIDAIIHNLR